MRAVKIILPGALGYIIGMLISCVLLLVLTLMGSRGGQTDNAVLTGGVMSEGVRATLDEFVAVNPFKVSPQRVVQAEPPKPKPEVKPVLSSRVLDGVILRGTLPGIGGWFEHNGQLRLMLVGHRLEQYRLSSVKYTEATFRRGHDTVKKYITYGPVSEVSSAPAPVRTVPSAPASSGGVPAGSITAAGNGQEGSIPAELVSSLVQNPFDELKRIRLRPSERDGGLEVQWIQNDSILRRLGVQRGDIVRSVNGIPFTNMGDIANSINSLINSERFDVEVTRGGKTEALRYVVR